VLQFCLVLHLLENISGPQVIFMSNSKDAKTKLIGKQRLRRRWLTTLRMARYGANNFTRNAWLTTAATAVMTITLLIIFMTFIARQALVSTVDELRQKVDISINLRSDIKDGEAKKVKQILEGTENVVSVRYIDIEEAKKSYIDQNHPSAEQLQAISDLPVTPFFPVFRVIVKDPNDTASLATLVAKNETVKDALNPDPKRAPSFTGEKKKVIETISRWTMLAERGGLIAAAVFIAISMLIIFNTIRMAIFNRKEEIQMMKLIGADKNFIRGPFVVEAVMYGFVAALIATVLGYTMLYYAEKPLSSYGVAVGPTLDTFVLFAPLVLLIMILIGALIGVLSSRLAVRRYLKV
jgi:cell division transport system permease protein